MDIKIRYLNIVVCIMAIIAVYLIVKKNMRPIKSKDWVMIRWDSTGFIYTNLLKTEMKSKITYSAAKNADSIYPVTLMLYDKSYSIIFHQLSIDINFSFDRDLIVQHRGTDDTAAILRGMEETTWSKINYSLKRPEDSSKLFINVEGNVSPFIMNDSLIDYYLPHQNISIGYDSLGNNILNTENEKTDYKTYKGQKEVMLIKRNGNLYFIIITSAGDNGQVEEGFLFKLLNLN